MYLHILLFKRINEFLNNIFYLGEDSSWMFAAGALDFCIPNCCESTKSVYRGSSGNSQKYVFLTNLNLNLFLQTKGF